MNWHFDSLVRKTPHFSGQNRVAAGFGWFRLVAGMSEGMFEGMLEGMSEEMSERSSRGGELAGCLSAKVSTGCLRSRFTTSRLGRTLGGPGPPA